MSAAWKLLPLPFVILLASPALAQRFEVSGLVGYTTTAGLDEVAPGLQGLDVTGGFTWAGQFDYILGPHLGLEASFSRRVAPLTLTTSSGSGELFEMDVHRLLGSVVYRFGGETARFRPFVLGGLGATFFGTEDIPAETKLAWAVGGGGRWNLGQKLGIKVQGTFSPTALNDEGSDFCDPFGFCSSSLHPFELLAGMYFRF